jgi:two-component system sensor histidine kinase/response regulator
MDSIRQNSSSPQTSGGHISSSPGPKHSRTTSEEPALCRLLVVEDNKVNQVVVLGILENLGYEADVVADGSEALSALQRRHYVLVLMDCQMPGMDGYQAARLIRQRGTAVRNHDIPIVAVMAHAMAGDRELCLAAGMNDYISRPCRVDLLGRTIKEWTAGAMAGNKLMTPPAGVASVANPNAFDSDEFIDRLMGNRQLAANRPRLR